MTTPAHLSDALDALRIPHADDVRGNVTLPEHLPGRPHARIVWSSSHPDVVSATPRGAIAPGMVRRPPPGSEPVEVMLTACVLGDNGYAIVREMPLRVRPAVTLAPFSRYGMANFARSNSTDGQQIYLAASVGNDPTRWRAVGGGSAVLRSGCGMHAVRDPAVVRSPEGDRFFLIATDLNVDSVEHGWRGWDWAQSGASRFIEVWESTDLRTWSAQRHVLVAPEEAGMAFAPEAIWDPTIGAFVVYWTSSMYPEGTSFSEDRSAPDGRYPLTRNETLYATTRDFVTFTPAQKMIDRPGHGTLDAHILRDHDGTYHRFVCDRISTGDGTSTFAPCGSEDIYQESSRTLSAPPEEWELVTSCITHRTMGTIYAEAPMAILANPGDVRGGCYLWADQRWEGSPAGEPLEQQLAPYWAPDLSSGSWTPIPWETPDYHLARGVMRHGSIFALTSGEHAALRGVMPVRLEVTPVSSTAPDATSAVPASLLEVHVHYDDGSVDGPLAEGTGGFLLTGLDRDREGSQLVTVSYAVCGTVVRATVELTLG